MRGGTFKNWTSPMKVLTLLLRVKHKSRKFSHKKGKIKVRKTG